MEEKVKQSPGRKKRGGPGIGSIRDAAWLWDESGTSVVEVITAFSVLVFVFGMLFQALAVTSRIMIRSHELRKESRDLAGYYYLQGTGDGLISEEGKSMEARTDKLVIRLDERGETDEIILEIPVTIREFKGMHESLFDAVPETKGMHESLFDAVPETKGMHESLFDAVPEAKGMNKSLFVTVPETKGMHESLFDAVPKTTDRK